MPDYVRFLSLHVQPTPDDHARVQANLLDAELTQR